MSLKTTPQSVTGRLCANLPRYQTILGAARARDVGEADTVTIVKDMLADIFGYDKYEDLTSEYCIRGTYVDLAIKVDGVLQTLIEVKSIGTDLRESHAKQAIDYAANKGVDWVILTNGQTWRIYNVVFAKPITANLVIEVNIFNLGANVPADVDTLFLWCKEGWQKSVLTQYQDQRKALSKFTISKVLLSDTVLSLVRRELRKVTPNVKLEIDQIAAVMSQEVIKRELIEGGPAVIAAVVGASPGNKETEGLRSSENSGRRKSVGLLELGLPIGAQLFFDTTDVLVTVEDNRKVLMKGEVMSLTAAAHQAGKDLGVSASGTPMLYWRYEGESLDERRVRLDHAGLISSDQPPR